MNEAFRLLLLVVVTLVSWELFLQALKGIFTLAHWVSEYGKDRGA